ncbi:ArsR family transcriptional regulator [Furfurilactobacillus entadae]|uniref:ArsR family transcriptional regulator n=1 Tax=Furfurilactobacillus entadae TaxID=2922307 RepID=UPI0035EB509E
MTEIENLGVYQRYANYHLRNDDAVVALKKYNKLSFLELLILHALSIEDYRVVTVAKEFNVSQAAISFWLKRLLNKGLITDISGGFDHRVRHYGLTEKGEERFKQALETLELLDRRY